jgi:hypothetical protein
MEGALTDVVEKLWELQTVLSKLAEKERGLHDKPEGFAAIDREYQASAAENERLTKRLDELATARSASETELQDAEDVLKKYQGQLMQVKNQLQYSAAWKEIDTARRRVKELEDQLLAGMSDIEAAESALEERRAPHEELRARHETEYGAWQHSLGDLRGEIEATRKTVEGIEAGIPEKLKRQFYRVHQQRQGVAMAKVVARSCSQCRVQVRPQVIQQLKRGEMEICEGCHRFFYLDRMES